MEKVKKINGTFLSFFYIFVTILTLLKCHYKGKGSCKYNISAIGERGSVKWGHLLTGAVNIENPILGTHIFSRDHINFKCVKTLEIGDLVPKMSSIKC